MSHFIHAGESSLCLCVREWVSVFACDKIHFQVSHFDRLGSICNFEIIQKEKRTFYWIAKKQSIDSKDLFWLVLIYRDEENSSRSSFFRHSKEHLLMFSWNWLIFFWCVFQCKAAVGMCVYVCICICWCWIGAFKPIDRNVIQMRIKMILLNNDGHSQANRISAFEIQIRYEINAAWRQQH